MPRARSRRTARAIFQINVDGQQVTQLMLLLAATSRATAATRSRSSSSSTNRFDATQGRSQGMVVNAITKSGTNTPAGHVLGLLPRRQLNAKDFIQQRVLPYSEPAV